MFAEETQDSATGEPDKDDQAEKEAEKDKETVAPTSATGDNEKSSNSAVALSDNAIQFVLAATAALSAALQLVGRRQ